MTVRRKPEGNGRNRRIGPSLSWLIIVTPWPTKEVRSVTSGPRWDEPRDHGAVPTGLAFFHLISFGSLGHPVGNGVA